MKTTWAAIGHIKEKKFLEQALKKKRLASSYLFIGPAHIGKTAVATSLARILLCMDATGDRPCGDCFNCKLNISANPDFFIIDSDEEIKIDKIRQLQKNFSLASFSNSYRVCVIANAELLNRESANALLKVLEEPGAKLIFIFCVNSLDTLPQTLVSRSQRLYFAHCDLGDLKIFLQPYKLNKKQSAEIEVASLGRIGLAKKFLEDEQYLQDYLSYKQDLEILLERPLSERLMLSSRLGTEATDLKVIFNYWALLLDKSLENVEDSQITIRLKLLKALAQGLQNLDFNVNRKLLVDSIALAL